MLALNPLWANPTAMITAQALFPILPTLRRNLTIRRNLTMKLLCSSHHSEPCIPNASKTAVVPGCTLNIYMFSTNTSAPGLIPFFVY